MTNDQMFQESDSDLYPSSDNGVLSFPAPLADYDTWKDAIDTNIRHFQTFCEKSCYSVQERKVVEQIKLSAAMLVIRYLAGVKEIPEEIRVQLATMLEAYRLK